MLGRSSQENTNGGVLQKMLNIAFRNVTGANAGKASASRRLNLNSKSVPVPKKVKNQISIDLMQMSECRGHKYFLDFQDYFSKWTEMVLNFNKKASTIAKELYF